MARYTGASCRQCRREGMKLFLKGERCHTEKCAIETRNYAPGQHGQGRKKVSGYGLQLREKQKVKRIYGVLETQFRNLYERAEKMNGMTGVNNSYVFKDENSKKFWARSFCEAASEIEDCIGLLAVLKDPSLETAYTASRKALRVIDFIHYGPTIA